MVINFENSKQRFLEIQKKADQDQRRYERRLIEWYLFGQYEPENPGPQKSCTPDCTFLDQTRRKP